VLTSGTTDVVWVFYIFLINLIIILLRVIQFRFDFYLNLYASIIRITIE